MGYNERLNDVIQNAYTVGQQFGTTTEELKQAITSLIKELVAEAKPMVASKEVIETYLQNGMTQKAATFGLRTFLRICTSKASN